MIDGQPIAAFQWLLVALWADVSPDALAIVHGREQVYRVFHERCRRLARALAQRNLGRGDTVAALVPNMPDILKCPTAC